MGLFDGGGIFGKIADVAVDVAGGLLGVPQTTAPYPQQTVIIPPSPAPYERYDAREKFFGETLPNILSTIPKEPTKQEIILKLPEETKESGQMENGPQVYRHRKRCQIF